MTPAFPTDYYQSVDIAVEQIPNSNRRDHTKFVDSLYAILFFINKNTTTGITNDKFVVPIVIDVPQSESILVNISAQRKFVTFHETNRPHVCTTLPTTSMVKDSEVNVHNEARVL